MSDITVKEMIESANIGLEELTPQEVKNKLNLKDTIIVDIRDYSELVEAGIIPGSHHASRGHLEFFADPACEYYKKIFNKEKQIILYCHTGSRSALACKTLKNMGYKKISHIAGGFKSWMEHIGIIDDYK